MASHGVSIVVLRPRSVLLVKRAKAPFRGYWSFPGGRIAPCEADEAAARRELREETGLSAGRLSVLGQFAVRPDPGGMILTVFAGQDRGGKPVAGDDAAEAVFVPFEEVLTFPHTPRLPDWISRALLWRGGLLDP